MATIVPNRSNGYTIQGANHIVANFTITVGEQPDGPPGGTPFIFTITFPRGAANPPRLIVGSLSRDLPVGGPEFTSTPVSTPSGDVPVPLGVFNGRSVVWNVSDNLAKRILQVTITSLDTMGTGEVWHEDLQITVPPGGTANFDVAILSGIGSVTSVNVTP